MKNRKGHDKFRVSLLKSSSANEFKSTHPPPVLLQFGNKSEEYEVDETLNHRRRRRQLQFLVKWKGCNDHETFWEPKTNLQGCQELFRNFRDWLDYKVGGVQCSKQ